MASKQTAHLIPLCHPISIQSVDIEFEICSDTEIEIQSTVKAIDRTGVEMEALVAASSSALTIYDMCKAIDRTMKVEQIRLEEKLGGKSGHFVREEID